MYRVLEVAQRVEFWMKEEDSPKVGGRQLFRGTAMPLHCDSSEECIFGSLNRPGVISHTQKEESAMEGFVPSQSCHLINSNCSRGGWVDGAITTAAAVSRIYLQDCAVCQYCTVESVPRRDMTGRLFRNKMEWDGMARKTGEVDSHGE